MFLKEPYYYIGYIPFYMNTGSFLLGLAGGIVYCENRKGHINLRENKVSTNAMIYRDAYEFFFSSSQILFWLWQISIPICFAFLLSGYIFYNYEFEKPAIWMAVYSILIRDIWGAVLPILVIGISVNIGCAYTYIPLYKFKLILFIKFQG